MNPNEIVVLVLACMAIAESVVLCAVALWQLLKK